MIPKPIHNIGPDDLQALMDEQVREGKTIEYKLELPGNADSQKARFLASVSSLANTAGGDHLFGVEEAEGLPVDFPGVASADPDAEILRMEQMLAGGLEPRLPRVDIHPVQLANGRYVFVLRVPKSWVSPHRVRQNGRFYGRNSAGRYELDVGELRSAFTLSETIADRIRNFRTDRVAKVHGDETPVTLVEGGRLVFHLVPLLAFATPLNLDVAAVYDHDLGRQLLPLTGGSWTGFDEMFNLDGVVTYLGAYPTQAEGYTQLFRSGIIETALPLERTEQRPPILRSTDTEGELIDALGRFLSALVELGVGPPVYAFLSLVGVRGGTFQVAGGYSHPKFRDDVVILPEIVIENFDHDASSILRPMFDMLWNTCGLRRSRNYDDEGNWTGRG
jgi:hypothetical protein